uniref:Coiled-coil domain-containing protein 25 n=1 Tax=Ciona intestinalis TaxID=7719 RepID=F6W3C3_CIOIN|nr:coiled-coil domain-containing protein 25 [Ciona intestinalis]|eukprot:XP_026689405.1 coiled-coil domain-containing protein 25 [Ciona intestinalis]
MVFYFTSRISGEEYVIYVGEDKYENEDLIKYGWPEDVWFHVDKVSSAHVYLRLKKDQTIEDIPAEVLSDCAQLVKANSIQGNKMNNVQIVYTPWSNLKKTGDMADGQVGFFKQKEVKLTHVEKRINETVNRLNKTKVEKHPDFMQEKEDRMRLERNELKKLQSEQRLREKEEIKRKREEKELRSYTTLFDVNEMKSNQDGNDSDDFM